MQAQKVLVYNPFYTTYSRVSIFVHPNTVFEYTRINNSMYYNMLFYFASLYPDYKSSEYGNYFSVRIYAVVLLLLTQNSNVCSKIF